MRLALVETFCTDLARLEDIATEIATLVVFLPSRHEGGRIKLVQEEASVSFCTDTHSADDYQYLAVGHGINLDVENITSGARFGLVYRLCLANGDCEPAEQSCASDDEDEEWNGYDDTSEGASAYSRPDVYTVKDSFMKFKLAPLRWPMYSSTPEMQNLRQVLSRWTSSASDKEYPSVLVLTLEHDYSLDLTSCPHLRGDDLHRVHALRQSAKELDLDLYYTVMAQDVAAIHDMFSDEKLESQELQVKSYSLEMLLQLHDGPANVNVKGLNIYRDSQSTPFAVSRGEVLHSARHIQTSRQSRAKLRRLGINGDRKPFRHVYVKCSVFITCS